MRTIAREVAGYVEGIGSSSSSSDENILNLFVEKEGALP